MEPSEMRESGWSERAARRRQRAIDAEASIVRSELRTDDPGRLARYGLGFITLLLIALPITFGGVHATVYGPVEIGIFALITLLAWCAPAAVTTPCGPKTVYRTVLRAGTILLTYLLLRGVADVLFATAEHPVLGSGVQRAALREVSAWLREVIVFLAAVVSVRTLIAIHPRAFGRLTTAIVVSGVITATIGLSHWFYDNGRLFWFFEPANVFISQRARWPFVNSNHLACFLVPPFFLLIGRCFAESAVLRTMLISQRTGRAKSLADLASDERFQLKVVRLLVTGALAVAILLCIIATLSRGVWFGTVIGIISFLVLDRLSRPRDSKGSPPAVESPSTEQRAHHLSSRRRRRSSRSSRQPFAPSAVSLRKIRSIAIALFCLAVFLFLRDRGAELVESRIEYGLLHSKEDMRFQLLADTWPLIKSHPWFGLGLGGWTTAYAAVMSPLLAGIDPVYLHSDPVQFLAETGLIGILLAVWCVGVLLVNGCRTLKRSRDRLTHVALVSALLSTLVGTAFDFHLRIPAIVFQIAVVISLIIELADSPRPELERNESRRGLESS